VKLRGGDPLLSHYTPSHYILDKGLDEYCSFITGCIRVAQSVTGHVQLRVV